MKKKFYAILLTAVFLVGVITASAFAADTGLTVTSDTDSSKTATTTAETKTDTIDVTIKQFQSAKYNITLVAAKQAAVTATVSGSSNLTIATDSLSGMTSNANSRLYEDGNFTVTPQSGTSGTVTVTFVVTDAIKDSTNDDETAVGTYTVTLNVTITPADKPTWNVGDTELKTDDDLSTFWDGTNNTFFAGQTVTKADISKTFKATTTNDKTTLKMVGTFNPTTSGLEFKTGTVGENGVLEGWVEGTVNSTLTKETDYTLKVVATDQAGSTDTMTVTFKVTPATKINASNKPGAITWGQEFSFTPSLSTGAVKTDGWAISTTDKDGATLSGTDYLTTAAMLTANGLTFTPATGAITGTWVPTVASADDGTDGVVNFDKTASWKGADITTKKIVLKATNGINGDDAKNSVGYQEFTLTFKGVAPTITQTASDVTSAFSALTHTGIAETGPLYNKALPAKGATGAIALTATGPGKITWTVDPSTGKLDDYGLVITEQDDATSTAPATLTITGTPKTTVKSLKLKITAVNGKGKSTTIEPTITIGSDAMHFYSNATMADPETALTDDYLSNSEKSNLTGNKKVGDTFTDLVLYARPGPVKWTATNLPAGITLNVDTKDSTKATLKGSFTGARKDAEDATKHYSIKAVNTNFTNLEDTLSEDVMVWAKPEITSATLFKKNVIETD
ncbi:MAG: hypothetical protein IKN30_06430, partial [Synergistaceae bacterium]|nr:hypothetical protein [Synergistaceae bacterium]